MEKPNLIKEFSKNSNQDERDLLAQKIRAERNEGHETKKLNEINEAEKETEFEKLKQEILELRNSLEEISNSGWRKFADYFKLKKIRAELEIKEQEKQELKSGLGKQKFETSNFAEKTEKLLKDFYNSETERWKKAEYTAEDVEKYFNPEHLASLSIEEYELLLQRFPSQMVTHVTRQGVRDHLGAVQHFAGLHKHWDGFKDIMEGRVLRHQLSLFLGEEEKYDQIKKFIKEGIIDLDACPDKELALNALNNFVDIQSTNHDGSLWDYTSVHVATEEVANAHYGAEQNNEIFFTFPSALIASQYAYSGQLNKAEGGYHNNQLVWAKDEEGLPIDAGIVFIPKNTMVSRKNGSRYELDGEMKPAENAELFESLEKKILKPELKTLTSEMISYLGNLPFDAKRIISLKEEEVAFDEKTVWNNLNNFKKRIEEIVETKDPRIVNMFFLYDSLLSLNKIYEGNVDTKKLTKDMLYIQGLYFKEAEDSVRAEEYWESYFSENPKSRPSKIVYYEQSDPTTALLKWIENKNLKGGFQEVAKDFEKNRVSKGKTEKPEHLSHISERFKKLFEKVIDYHYQNN